MKILWIVNGLSRDLQAKYGVATYDMATWIEALLKNTTISKNTFEIFVPQNQGREKIEFVEDGIKFVLFDNLNVLINKIEEGRFNLIHVWGMEYSYSKKIIECLEINKLLHKTILSIQGISVYIGMHYLCGLPKKIVANKTFRDWIKRDSIYKQQKTFLNKGNDDRQITKKLQYISGRTKFDEAFVCSVNDQIQYYKCEEAMRPQFYKECWNSQKCIKGRIFMSQGYYSIKGLHFALEAIRIVKNKIPNVKLVVAGIKPIPDRKYKDSTYAQYIRKLIDEYELENSVEFLGQLNEERMIQEYLKSNVFIMPSVVENSPNSLSEAMLLGMPIIASYVGGIPDMIVNGETGYLYQHDAPYMLAHYIEILLKDVAMGRKIGEKAREIALEKYNLNRITQRWDEIYEQIAK